MLHQPDYSDAGPPDDSAVARLIPTMSNKLATVSFGVDEQSGIEGCNPVTVSLVQVLLMQATCAAARQAVTCENLDSFGDMGHTVLALRIKIPGRILLIFLILRGYQFPPETLPRSKLSPNRAQGHWLSY